MDALLPVVGVFLLILMIIDPTSESNDNVILLDNYSGILMGKGFPFSLPRESKTLQSPSVLNSSSSGWLIWVIIGLMIMVTLILTLYLYKYLTEDDLSVSVKTNNAINTAYESNILTVTENFDDGNGCVACQECGGCPRCSCRSCPPCNCLDRFKIDQQILNNELEIANLKMMVKYLGVTLKSKAAIKTAIYQKCPGVYKRFPELDAVVDGELQLLSRSENKLAYFNANLSTLTGISKLDEKKIL